MNDWVPELKGGGVDQVTIEHLLQMTSGMDYRESDINPFTIHAHLFHAYDIEKEVLKFKLAHPPGQVFEYKSGDYALLSLILTRALGEATLTQYLQEKIWTPLGMEHDGLWAVDRLPDGLEKAWCCISATAIDFAKIGQLYLNRGIWLGQQIVSPSWVQHSTQHSTADGSAPFYQYGWYIMSEDAGDFRAEGVLGQFIYVNPKHQVIIVRLGRSLGGIDWRGWKRTFSDIANGVR